MKTSTQYISLILAASAALFAIANASFSAFLGSDVALAIVTSASVIGFAVYDYSRRSPSLKATAPVLRPNLPVSEKVQRTIAYSAKSPRADRVAA